MTSIDCQTRRLVCIKNKLSDILRNLVSFSLIKSFSSEFCYLRSVPFINSLTLATKRLHKRVCPSVGPSVHPSIHPSVTLSLFGLLEATLGRVSGHVIRMKRNGRRGARVLFQWEGEEQICVKNWWRLSFVLNENVGME